MSEIVARVGVVFITHRAVRLLPQSLPPLLDAYPGLRVLVVNSSSLDGTVELAQRLGAATLVVPRAAFNHGRTRELARHRLGAEITVMMTPDAVADHPEMLERLCSPLLRGEAEVAYARQIPHAGAGYFEAFPRWFNYGCDSHVRSAADQERYGSYLYFCSDACAAWSNAALDRVGGFDHVLTQEDAWAVAKILAEGGRVAYVAEAVVRHSHRHTPWAEFRRHFDIGWERRRPGQALFAQGDARRGRQYAAIMLQQLARRRPWLLPYGVLLLAAKYAGYRVGARGRQLPRALVRRLSAQDFYWMSAIDSTPQL